MNKKAHFQSTSIRPTHGTAKQVVVPSIIPKQKADKEVFWVEQLLARINIKSENYKVIGCRPLTYLLK